MTYLLKNAQLLDAEHNHAPLDVLIDGTTIAAVGTDLSSIDQVIDLSGYTILPGFVDAHVHVAVDDRAFKEDAVRAWAYNGVTGLCPVDPGKQSKVRHRPCGGYGQIH